MKKHWFSGEKISLIFKDGFIKNIAILATGTASVQIINFAIMPLITRLYSAEAFGSLGLFSSIIGLMIVISALSYPLAVVFVKENHKYRRLVKLSIKLIMIIGFLLSIILLFITTFFTLPFNGIVGYLCLAFLPASLTALYSQILLRQKKFKVTAYIGLVSAMMVAFIKLVAGVYNPSSAALILAAILGFCVSSFIMHVIIFGCRLPVKKLTFSFSEKVIMKEFKQFPFYRLPQAFNVALSQLVPVALITHYFGLKAAGYFVLTRTVLTVPVTLFGKAVFDVAYPKLSTDFGTRPISKFITNTTISLMAISSIPLLILLIWGPELFSWVFGSDWERSGIYAGCMSLWFVFSISNRPSVAAVSILGLDKFLLINGVAGLFFSVIGFIIANFLWATDKAAILSFFSCAILSQVILILKVNTVAKYSDENLFLGSK